MDERPPAPHPVAPKGSAPPSGDVPHPEPTDCLQQPAGENPPVPPSPRPNRLDPQETTVSDGLVRRFLEEAPPPPPALLSSDWKENLLAQIGPAFPEENFLHSGWKHLRKRVADAMFRTVQSDSRIRAFLTCGRGGWVERAIEDHSRTRVRIPYCHDRMCMVCGNHRSHRIRDALVTQIGKGPVSFITLTLCGKGEALNDLVDRLYKHFRALRLHPTWAEKVRGGAAFLEIKWSDKAQRWHPHLHIIADASYVPKYELSDAWRSISKDSFIVDIKRVNEAQGAVGYVSKYASKPMDSSIILSPDKLAEALVALKGRRLCLCFGTWYGTPLSMAEDEELADDLVDAAGYERVEPLWVIFDAANDGASWAVELVKNTPNLDAMWRFSLLDST